MHAAQHLHGGIGVDLDYPVHRYFRWTKVIELSLGTATEHLRRLGRADRGSTSRLGGLTVPAVAAHGKVVRLIGTTPGGNNR